MNKTIAALLAGPALLLNACADKPATPAQVEVFNNCVGNKLGITPDLKMIVNTITLTSNPAETVLDLDYQGTQPVIAYGAQPDGSISARVTDYGQKILDAATPQAPTPNFRVFARRLPEAIAACPVNG